MQVIQPFTTVISSGTLVGIAGGSGSGKSTLLRAIYTSIVREESQEILAHLKHLQIQGNAHFSSDYRLLRFAATLVHADAITLNVFDYLYAVTRLSFLGRSTSVCHDLVHVVLELLQLNSLQNRKIDDMLSDGEQRYERFLNTNISLFFFF